MPAMGNFLYTVQSGQGADNDIRRTYNSDVELHGHQLFDQYTNGWWQRHYIAEFSSEFRPNMFLCVWF